jgi:hypothetical protein
MMRSEGGISRIVFRLEMNDEQLDWSECLIDSLWFNIARFLSVNDIERLSRTCSRLRHLLITNDFWAYLIRARFGSTVWRRFSKQSSLFNNDEQLSVSCRSKEVYLRLSERHCISFSDIDRVSFDNNRHYQLINDPSSLTGKVLQIHDSVEFCYDVQIETVFKDILPGRYDVIWRMKLNLPYLIGETEFVAIPEQDSPKQVAFTRWTEEDFLSMYRCFHCDLSNSNLWFYQQMGIVEITGDQPCHVYVSMVNADPIHAKHGLFLDFVELKLRLE